MILHRPFRLALLSAALLFISLPGFAKPPHPTLAWLLKMHRLASSPPAAGHDHQPEKAVYALQAEGLTGTLTEYDSPPNKTLVQMTLGPIHQTSGDNGKVSWQEDMTGHVRILTGPELAQDRATQSFTLEGYDPIRGSHKGTVTLNPKREPGTGDYVLQVTPIGGTRQMIYLNPHTYLVSKIITTQEGITGQIKIQAYRNFFGVPIPSQLLISYAGLPVTVTANLVSAVHEPSLSSALFNPPVQNQMDFSFLTPTGKGPAIVDYTDMSGEIVVPVTVNGAPLRLLLDSGAGSSFLTGAAAKSLNLSLSGDIPAVGYGGAATTGVATHATLELPGAVRLPNEVLYVLRDPSVTQALTQNGGIDGALGYDLFSRFAITIDYQAKTLTFTDPAAYRPPPGAIIVPLRLDTRTPTVIASIDGRPPTKFLIDTGDNGFVHLYQNYAQAQGLVPAENDPKAEVLSGVGVGGSVKETVTPGHDLQIGGQTLPNIPVAIIGGGGITKVLHQAGGIGDAVLSHFIVTFDDTHNRLILQPVSLSPAAAPPVKPAVERLPAPPILLASAVAQNADMTTAEILKRHLAALGGFSAVSSITSTRVAANVITGGEAGTVVTAYKAPEDEYEDDKIGLVNITQGYNGKVAWQEDSNGNVRLLGPDEIENLRNELYFDTNSYVIPGPIPGKITLRPQRDPVNGDYILDALPKGGKPTTIYLDPKTFLIVEEQHKDDNVTITTTYQDYHKVNGVEFPFAQKTTNGDARYDLSLKVQEIQNNVPIPSALFQEPQQTTASDFVVPGATSATVPFDFNDGEIGLDITLNGHPCRVFLDSGASGIALSEVTANALHLPQSGYLEARGYGGSTDLTPVKIDTLEIPGAIRLKNIVAVAIPLSPALTSFLTHPIAGFVGYDLLSRFVVRIDFPKRQITFIAPDSFHPTSADGVPLKAALDDDIPTVTAQLDSLPPARFLVDSGDEADLRLYVPYITKNNLNQQYPGGVTTEGGGIGGISTARMVRVNRFTLAGITLKGIPADFSLDTKGGESQSEAGSIGAGLLSRFIVTFDYPHGVIYFAPGPTTLSPFDTNSSGLAITLANNPNRIEITGIDPTTAQQFKNIQPGDNILSVDGIPAMQMGITGVRQMLTGADGKTAHTLIIQSPQGQTQTVTMPVFDPLASKEAFP